MNGAKHLSVIVPYRNRAEHLKRFIPHMRHYLPNAEILVVEQMDTKPFNRAKLLNVGSLEAEGDYFCHHDVDMLGVNPDYSYPDHPTHIATQVSQFGYKMPYLNYFGGVTLFNRKDFFDVNGYSNYFFSYGAEDDEMYNNVIAHGKKVVRRLCRFESMPHPPADRSLYHVNMMLLSHGRQPGDGVTHCNYVIEDKISKDGYHLLKTHV